MEKDLPDPAMIVVTTNTTGGTTTEDPEMWIRTVATVLTKVGMTIMIVIMDDTSAERIDLMNEKATGLMETSPDTGLDEET